MPVNAVYDYLLLFIIYYYLLLHIISYYYLFFIPHLPGEGC